MAMITGLVLAILCQERFETLSRSEILAAAHTRSEVDGAIAFVSASSPLDQGKGLRNACLVLFGAGAVGSDALERVVNKNVKGIWFGISALSVGYGNALDEFRYPDLVMDSNYGHFLTASAIYSYRKGYVDSGSLDRLGSFIDSAKFGGGAKHFDVMIAIVLQERRGLLLHMLRSANDKGVVLAESVIIMNKVPLQYAQLNGLLVSGSVEVRWRALRIARLSKVKLPKGVLKSLKYVRSKTLQAELRAYLVAVQQWNSSK